MRRSQPLPRQDMFEVKPPAMAKKESSTETDEGLGSSGKRCGSGSFGSVSAGSGASLYLSDSQDWVISPSCSPDEPPAHHHHHHHALSPMLAEETFRYMTYLALEPSPYSHSGSKVLSGDRVEQMAKTYNDIEVVTHLLVERDRDLELAARIGQSLLQRNNLLQERNEAVEEQLAQALDQVNQLQHELAKKDELLRMVASASEESETDSSCSTPHRQPPHHHHGGISAAAALSQLEALQSKLQEMEEENLALRSEACHLKSETITYEEKEQQLVSDCVKELRESNSQMVALTEELSKKNQDLLKHQEEIAQLLSQIVDLQHRVKELALEKEELRIHLQASKDSQRQLTAELNELAERNAECVGMLHESQEEIKELRNKNTPSAGMRRHLSYGLYPMDSLAAEIEGTMRRELSVEEEMSVQEQRDALEPLRISQKKVFQTVRAVKASASAARAFSPVPPIPGSGRSSLVMTAQPFTSNQGEEANRLGQPGSPGRNDLTEALHRLSLRRHNFLCEQQFFLTERERKLQALAAAAGEEEELEVGPADGSVCGSTPSMGSRLSSYSNLSELSLNTAIFKTFLPEKLQIVKPMEGSLTLHHWQQLAKPHLGTILDPHPGVVTKGFRPLAQDAVYRLTDLEEDEEDNSNEDRSRGGRDGKSRGGRDGAREKGSAEESYTEGGIEEDDEEEEEEGGITFKARCSSTPEEKERKHPPPPLCSPALRGGSPITTTTTTTSSSSSPPRPDLSLDFGGSDVIGTSPFPPARSISTSPTSAPIQSESCFATPVTTTTTAAATTGSYSDACPVLNPGKCQCSTFSTYTFTTCRILHPSDITQVTSSSYPQSSSSSSTQLANTPSSMRTGPNTPVTPCRLSLGDSFPPSLRRPVAAVPPPGRLAKLVLEKGISAQGISRTAASAAPAATDNFLASRPAELFLQDVYGLNLGRAPTHPDLPSPSASSTSTTATIADRDKEETTSGASRARSRADSSSSSGPPVGLMERLCRLGFSKVLQGTQTTEQTPPQNHHQHHHRRQDSSTFVVAAGGGSLLDGLRRNQSLPAMIGGGARGPAQNPNPLPPPPPHPTSLAIPPPPWGDLKDRRRRPASVSHPPGSAKN